MIILEKQLSLFGPDPDTVVGGVSCSLGHRKPKRAKWRVHFKNYNCRDVCGWCVRQFRAGGKYADRVDKITKLKI